MKRLILLFAAIIFSVVHLSAQQVVPSAQWFQSQSRSLYGLKDTSTGKWVVTPQYLDVSYIISYEDVDYFGVKSMKGLWGVISSSDFSKLKVPHMYDDIHSIKFLGAPIIIVQKESRWGGIELYTDKCETIFPFIYTSVSISSGKSGVVLELGNRYETYTWGEVEAKFEKTIARVKQEEESCRLAEEARKKEAEKEQARIALEKKLSSFTNYAKDYVTPIINEWQKKGEFEKVADYEARVMGENRLKKIEELTKEAEQLFFKEYEKLEPLKNMTLGAYDADNEVFAIHSAVFGQLLLPVSIAEGETFKKNFASMVKLNPEYFIQNDKIALRSLVFTNPKTNESYKYSNNAGLNYTQYEINADSFGFDSIHIPVNTAANTAVDVSTTVAKSTVKPACRILSPKNNDTYTDEYITINYVATVGAGLTYTLKVSVNGEDVEPELLEGTSKGVKVASGKEMRIKVPRKVGEPCNISMYIADSEGVFGEPQKLRLHYIGEAPKSKLHILSVGVSNYQSKDLEVLSYAAKDAQDFINAVANADVEMYSSLSSQLLVNDKATRNEVMRSLRALVANVDQGDVVMLYFSGHGIKDGEEAFYMTYDSSAEDCFTGVNFSDIRTQIRKLAEEKKCHVLLFIDACHSGAMYGMKGATMELTMKVPGLIGFYSSTSGQQSAELDKLQNGAFTHAIIQAFEGGAKNENGEITIMKLENYVRTKVKENTNNRQEPIIENMMGDAVIFRVK